MSLRGYRGADGDTRIETPAYINTLRKLKGNPFSRENLNTAARALDTDFANLEDAGVELDSYTIIDVVDDLADFQRISAYKQTNLWSISYGTRIAYYYGLKYPENIQRTMMVSVNSPGGFVWEVPYIRSDLEHYNRLWKTDPEASLSSPDILETMDKVLSDLPPRWFGFELQRQKIEIATFLVLFHRENKTPSAAQAFNAYVAAEQGDYSGLALLNLLYDLTFPSIGIWGDRILKGVTADIEPERNYLADLYDEQKFYNSPLSAFLWGVAEASDRTWQQLPEEFRGLKPSSVETLMVSGNVDFSTPSEMATEDMLPILFRGKQIVLKEFGHVNDIYNLQPEAFQQLVLSYFHDGSVDDSLFEYEPMDFSPVLTFQTILKRTLGVIIGIPILILALITGLLIRRRRINRTTK